MTPVVMVIFLVFSSYKAGGISVEHIPFNDMKSCVASIETIEREAVNWPKNTVQGRKASTDTVVKAICMAR